MEETSRRNSLYTGSWEADRRSGYGVYEDKMRYSDTICVCNIPILSGVIVLQCCEQAQHVHYVGLAMSYFVKYDECAVHDRLFYSYPVLVCITVYYVLKASVSLSCDISQLNTHLNQIDRPTSMYTLCVIHLGVWSMAMAALSRHERYLGMWSDGVKSGPGMFVTSTGSYGEAIFSSGTIAVSS